LVHRPQLAAPPVEEFERPDGVADFVAQVVGPSAEGVDALERRAMLAGREPGDDAEVLVMRGGEPRAVLQRLPPRDGFRPRGAEPPQIRLERHSLVLRKKISAAASATD